MSFRLLQLLCVAVNVCQHALHMLKSICMHTLCTHVLRMLQPGGVGLGWGWGGVGVGLGWVGNVHFHLHCVQSLMIRCKIVGAIVPTVMLPYSCVEWGGLAGMSTFACTWTRLWCYAIALSVHFCKQPWCYAVFDAVGHMNHFPWEWTCS